MGHIEHDAVIVTITDVFGAGLPGPAMPDVEAFRADMPDELRPLLVGPVKAATNGYVTYAFLPDGSKEGWETSDAGDEWRQRFVDLFAESYSDGSSPFHIVAVRWGGDADRAVITFANDRADRRQ